MDSITTQATEHKAEQLSADLTELLTAGDLARRLKVSLRQIRKLHSEALVPAPVMLGRSMRWRGSDLAAAQVAGTVALMLQAAPRMQELPGYSKMHSIRVLLRDNAAGNPTTEDGIGAGVLDTNRVVLAAQKFNDCLEGKAPGRDVRLMDGYECISESH